MSNNIKKIIKFFAFQNYLGSTKPVCYSDQTSFKRALRGLSREPTHTKEEAIELNIDFIDGFSKLNSKDTAE